MKTNFIQSTIRGTALSNRKEADEKLGRRADWKYGAQTVEAEEINFGPLNRILWIVTEV